MRRVNRVVSYEWDEQTEIGTFTYEDGSVAQKKQPLQVLSGQALVLSYYNHLFDWLQLDNRL